MGTDYLYDGLLVGTGYRVDDAVNLLFQILVVVAGEDSMTGQISHLTKQLGDFTQGFQIASVKAGMGGHPCYISQPAGAMTKTISA